MRSWFVRLSSAILMLALGGGAWGASYYWTGGGSDTNWTTVANWSTTQGSNTVATAYPTAGDSANFFCSTYTASTVTVTVPSAITVDTLNIPNPNSQASSFTLTFSGAGSLNVTSTATSVELYRPSSDAGTTATSLTTFNVPLTVAGTVFLHSGASLVLNATSTLGTMKGPNGAASPAIAVTVGASTTLTTATLYSGMTVTVASGASLSGLSGLAIPSGATLATSGTISTAGFTMDGTWNNTAANTLNASGSVAITGTVNTPANSTLVMSGTGTLASSATLGAVQITGTTSVGSALTVGSWTVSGTWNNTAANTLTVTGNVAVTGTLGTPASSTLVMSGTGSLASSATLGTLQITGSVTAASDINVSGTTTVPLGGTLNLATGTPISFDAAGGMAYGQGTINPKDSVLKVMAGNPSNLYSYVWGYTAGTTGKLWFYTNTAASVTLPQLTTVANLVVDGSGSTFSYSNTTTVTGNLSVINGATFSSSSTFTIGGNFDASGGTVSGNPTLVFSGTTAGSTLAAGTGLTLGGLTLAKSTQALQLSGGLTVSGTLSLTSGTFQPLSGSTLTLSSGTWDDSNVTFQPTGGTVTLTAYVNITQKSGNVFSSLTLTKGGAAASGLVVNGTLSVANTTDSTALAMNSYSLTVGRSIVLSGLGGFSSSGAISVGGDWTKSTTGTVSLTGTVTFTHATSTTHTITGSTTFANLVCSSGAYSGVALILTAGSTQTISGTFTATGASTSNLVSLTSSTSGSTATLAGGTFSVDYAYVKDVTFTPSVSITHVLSGGNAYSNTTLITSTITTTYIWTGGAGSGNVDDTGNWSSGAVPTSAKDVIIPSGLTYYPDLTTPSHTALTAQSLTVQPGASFTLTGGSLTVTNALATNGTFTLNGSETLSAGSISVGGSVVYNNAQTGTLELGNSYANVTFSAGATLAANLVVTGTLTVPSSQTLTLAGKNLTGGGVLAASSATVALRGDETLTLASTAVGTANYNDSGTTVSVSGLSLGYSYTTLSFTSTASSSWSLQSNLAVSGTVTVNSGATLNLQTYNVTGAGTGTNNGTVKLAGGNTLFAGLLSGGTVVFVGNGDGTGDTLTVPAGTYNNLTISDPTGLDSFSTAGAVVVTGNLTLTQGTLKTNGYAVSVAGNLAWASTAGFTPGATVVSLNGSSVTQTLTSGGHTWSKLAVAGTTNVVQLVDAAAVSSTFTTASGTFVDLNGKNLTGTPTVTHAGTLRLQGTETLGSTLVTAFGAGPAVLNGTGSYSGTGGLTTASSLIVASGTHTLASSFAVTGSVDIASGATLATSTYTLTVGGAFNASGGTFTGTGGTLKFNGASAQTLNTSGGTFGTVESANALGVTLGGLATVANVVIDSGATLADGGFVLTLTGNWTNSGGTYTATGTLSIVDTAATGHTFTGSSSFKNFTIDASGSSGAVTATFAAGSTQTITGTLTLKGTSANHLSLVSSAATAFVFDVTNATLGTIQYVDVTWGTATGKTIAVTTGTGSNVVNWTFSGGILYWLGATSDPTLGSNWSSGVVLNDGTESYVIDPAYKSGSFWPLVGASTTWKAINLTVASGAQVTIVGGASAAVTGTKTLSGTVVYQGTSAGTYGLALGTTYTNLTVASTAASVWQPGATLTVTGTLTVGASDTLDLQTNPLAGPVTAYTSTGTLRLAGSQAVALPAASLASMPGTVEFTGTTTTLGGMTGFTNLTVSAGSTTLASAAPVSGNLVVSGGTLVDNGKTITVSGTSVTVAAGATLTTTGTLVLSGTGAQTVTSNGKSWAAIQASKTAGTLQFTDAFSAASYTDAASSSYDLTFSAAGTITAATDLGANNSGSLTVSSGFTFTTGATKTVGTKTLGGTISSSASPLNFATTATTLGANTSLNAGTAAVTIGPVTGAGYQLSLAGSGADAVASTAGVGTFDLTGMTGGSVTVTGALVASTLSTGSGAYNLSLGSGTTITTAATLSNTGTLTLGQSGGTTTFTGGLVATAPSSVTVAGTVATSGAALSLGSASNGVVLAANTTLASGSGTAAINGAVTDGAGSYTLTLGNAGQTGAVSVAGQITVAGLATGAGAYNLTLSGDNASASTIDTSVTFSNTGTVQLGDAATDSLTFTGGVVSVAGPVKLAGTVAATGNPLNLNGAVTLVAATTLSSGTGTLTLGGTVNGAFPLTINTAGSSSAFGGVAGGATPLTGLTLNSGGTFATAGAVTVAGALTLSSGTLSMGAWGLAVSGNVARTSGTLTSTGTLTLNGAAVQTVDLTGSSIANLDLSNSSGATLNNTAPFTWSGNASMTGPLKLANVSGQTIGGNVTGTNGSSRLDLSLIASGNSVTVGGTIGANASTSLKNLSAPAGTLNVAGTLWNVTNVTSSGTIAFTAATAQTIVPNGQSFGTVAATGTGGVTLTGTATFASLAVAAGETFTLAGTSVTSLTLSGTGAGVLTTGASGGLRWNATGANVALAFTGAAPQIANGNATGLQVTAGSSTNVASLSSTNAATLSGSPLSLNGQALTVTNLSTSLAHTLTTTDALTLAGSNTFGGGLTVNASGASVAQGTSALSASALTVTAGTYTLGAGSLAVTGALTVNGGTLNVTGTPTTFTASSLAHTSGTIANTATYNLTVSGNVTVAGTFGTTTASTITMTGASATLAASSGLFNLVISGTVTLGSHALALAGTLTVGGTLTDTNLGISVAGTSSITGTLNAGSGTDSFAAVGGTGTLSASTGTTTISGNLTVTTFTPNGGTVVFSGGTTGAYTFFDVTIGGNVTSSGAWTIGGSLVISSGAWTAGAITHSIAGNWTNNVGSLGFVSTGSTIVFAGAVTHTIGGSANTTFANLSDTTGDSTLVVTSGRTLGVTGTLTLTGTSGHPITLKSSTAGSTWTLANSSGQSVSFVSVSDSPATLASISAANSTDVTGNNTNWSFGVITWVGGAASHLTDANWGANWSSGAVPGTYDSATVPAVANQPVQTALLVLKSLTLSSATSTWSNGGFGLTVSTTLANSGTFTYTGVGALSLPATTAGSPLGGTFEYSAGSPTMVSNLLGYTNLTVSGGTITAVATTVTTTLSVTGGTLSIPVATTLTAGTTSVGASGTLASSGTLGTGAFTSAGAITNPAANTINASGAVSFTGATFTNPASSTLTLTGASTLAATPTIGTVTVNSAGTVTAGGPLSLAGTLNLTAGTLSLSTNGLSVAGNVARTSGVVTSGGTVTLNGAGAQTVDFTGSTLANLTVFNTFGTSPQVTSGAAITLSGTLALTQGTLAMGTNALSVAGDVTRGTGAVTSTGTVTLAGTTQAVDFSTSTLTNLSLAAASGTVTSGGNLSLAGNLEVASGRTLAMTTYNLAVAGTTNAVALLNGTLTSTSGSQTFSGSFHMGSLTGSSVSSTFSGASVVFSTFTSGGGNVVFNGSTAQSVTPNGQSFGPVQMTGTGGVGLVGTATFSTLTVALGETFTLGGGTTTGVTVNGTFSNAGGTNLSSSAGAAPVTLTMGSGTTIANTGTLAVTNSTGTVTLAGTGATATTTTVTLTGSSLSVGAHALTLSGLATAVAHTLPTSAVVTLGGAATFSGGLTLNGAGASVAVGANTLTVGGLAVTTGTVSVTSGSVLAGATAISVGSGGALTSTGASTLTASSLTNAGALTINTTTPTSWAVTGNFTSTGTVSSDVVYSVAVGGNLAVSGTFDVTPLPTFVLSGTSATIDTAVPIGHLTASGTAAVTATGHAVQLAGNLTLGANTSLALSTFGATIGGAATGTAPANLTGGSAAVSVIGAFSVPTYSATTATTTFSGAVTLGTFSANGGTVTLAGTAGGSFTPNGAAFNALSVTNTAGSFTTPGSTAGSFSTATFTKPSGAGTFTLASGATMTVTTSLAASAGTLNLTGAYVGSAKPFAVTGATVNVGVLDFLAGDMTVSLGTFVQAGVNTGTDSVASLAVSGSGSCTWDSPATGGTLAIAGALSNTGTLNFNFKNVDLGTSISGAIELYDLTILNGTTLTPATSTTLTVRRNMTVQSGGHYSAANGPNLVLGGVNSVTGGVYTDGNGTPENLGTLIVNGGFMKTLASAIAASTLTVGDATNTTTLTATTHPVTVTGDLSGTGTLSTTSAAVTVGGSMTVATYTQAGGSVTFNGASASATNGYTFYNLAMNMGAPGTTFTPLAGITVTNSFTLTQGDFRPTAFTHSIAGNWNSSSANVTFATPGASTIVLTGAATVTTKAADRFHHLTLDGVTLLGSSVTTNGDLVVAATGSLNNGQAVTVGGNATLGGPVGGITPLTSLAITGTTAVNTSTVATSGAQTYTDTVTLGANSVLTVSTATFNSPVVGGGKTLGVTGNAVFGDASTDTVTGLASLSVSGTTTINTSTVTTTGNQTYAGVTLGADVTLTAPGAAIQMSTLAGGTHNLVLGANGAGTFTATGAVTNLGSGTGAALNVPASATGLVKLGSTVDANNGFATGSGTSVEFDGNVSIGGTTQASTFGGAVAFNKAAVLSFLSDQGVTFSGAVTNPGTGGLTLGPKTATTLTTYTATGTFTAGSGPLVVTGSWISTAGTLVGNASGTITFNTPSGVATAVSVGTLTINNEPVSFAGASGITLTQASVASHFAAVTVASGGLTLASDVAISGTLTQNSGSTWDLGGHTVFTQGNVALAGNLTATGSTLSLNGTGSVSVSSTQPLYNLIVNALGGTVTQASALTVSNRFAAFRGAWNAGVYSLTVNEDFVAYGPAYKDYTVGGTTYFAGDDGELAASRAASYYANKLGYPYWAGSGPGQSGSSAAAYYNLATYSASAVTAFGATSAVWGANVSAASYSSVTSYTNATGNATSSFTLATLTVGKNFFDFGASITGNGAGTLVLPTKYTNVKLNAAKSTDWFGYPFAVALATATGMTVASAGASQPVAAAQTTAAGTHTAGVVGTSSPTWTSAVSVSSSANWDNTAPDIDTLVPAATRFDDLVEVTFTKAIRNKAGEAVAAVNQATAADNLRFVTGATRAGSVWDFTPGTIGSAGEYATTANAGTADAAVLSFRALTTETTPTWDTDASGASAGTAASTDRSGVARTTAKADITLEKGRLYDLSGNPIVNHDAVNQNAVEGTTSSRYTATVDKARPVLVKVQTGQAAKNFPPSTPEDGHNFWHLTWSEPMNLVGHASLGTTNTASNLAATLAFGDSYTDTSAPTTVQVTGLFQYPGTLYRSTRTAADTSPQTNQVVANKVSNSIVRSSSTDLYVYLTGLSTGSGTSESWDGFWWGATEPKGSAYTVPAAYTALAQDLVGNAIDDANVVWPAGADPKASLVITSPGTTMTNTWELDKPTFAPYNSAAAVAGSYEMVPVNTSGSGDVITQVQFHILTNMTLSGQTWGGTASDSNHTTSYRSNTNYYGVRDSSLVNFASGLSLSIDNSTFSTAYSHAIAAPYGNYTSVDNTLFDGDATTGFTVSDDGYFHLEIGTSPALATPATWKPTVTFYAKYDPFVGMATNLAGRLVEPPVDANTSFRGIDRTPPTVSLTLTGKDLKRIYVQFSRKVGVTDPSADADFKNVLTLWDATAGAAVASTTNSITSLTFIDGTSTSFQQMYVNLAKPLTADNVVAWRLVAGNSTAVGTAPNYLDATTKTPLTNVGLDLVVPVWASDGSGGESSSTATDHIIHDFTGLESLAVRDIELQAKVFGSTSLTGLPLRMFYDMNVSSSLKANGLWLPNGIYSVYDPKVVPASGDTSARYLDPSKKSTNGDLQNFVVPGTDGEMVSGNTLEFLFRLGSLYVVRAVDPQDPTQIAPWKVPLKGIKTQKNGVTILHNVIDPTQGQKTEILYTVPRSGVVTAQVFALDGSLVRVLQRGRQASGDYSVSWDGKNAGGNVVARGVYFVRVVGPDTDETRNILVIK